MSKSKIMPLAALITVAILLSVTQTWAATMKFRLALFHKKAEIIEVADVEGHIMGVGEAPALASFETGEVAAGTLNWFADYIKGEGITQGYVRLTFNDGATITYKFVGNTRLDPNGKGSLFESQSVVIVRGTGKYAGIKGEGSYTGKRLAALGVGARLYTDVTLRYTLP